MKQGYQVADRRDSRAMSEFLSKDGQVLLPLLELIEKAELAVDELIDVAGRSTIEAVLTLSALSAGRERARGRTWRFRATMPCTGTPGWARGCWRS